MEGRPRYRVASILTDGRTVVEMLYAENPQHAIKKATLRLEEKLGEGAVVSSTVEEEKGSHDV